MTHLKTALEQRLIAAIEQSGHVTFRDFMQSALYDNDLGYYNTERLKIGAAGDYYTSSNIHPAFGAMLARAFAHLWSERAVGDRTSQPLAIVEAGAGTGQLAVDLLTAARDEYSVLFRGLSYVIVEASPAMRKRQQEMLAPFGDRVEWKSLDALRREPISGVIFSNELIDALPVHLVGLRGGKLEEAYVTIERKQEPRLTLEWAGPSTQRLADYIERLRVKLAEGQIIEVSLDAVDWLGQISDAIAEGHLVTIDYGDIAAHLYGQDRIKGTLRAFHRHRLIDSPLERIGEQDITASVNFTALIEYGADSGLRLVSFERQSAFLIRMGLIDRIALMESGSAGDISGMKARLALKNLFVPGGVSDNFRVLIQEKIARAAD
jgi:SAM-dependent MidA family methyltransferase